MTTSDKINKRLDYWQKIDDAATPGRWHWHGDRPFSATKHGDLHLDGFLGDGFSQENKNMIAFTRNASPVHRDVIRKCVEALSYYSDNQAIHLAAATTHNAGEAARKTLAEILEMLEGVKE